MLSAFIGIHQFRSAPCYTEVIVMLAMGGDFKIILKINGTDPEFLRSSIRIASIHKKARMVSRDCMRKLGELHTRTRSIARLSRHPDMTKLDHVEVPREKKKVCKESSAKRKPWRVPMCRYKYADAE
eukprot:Gregarina_sp_Pseudo_9__3386@NODE_355_length_3077_cov_25_407505_g334_i0_p3_GENE_NODE_355_length_3077_cov_25_407505_g334_i0NODE_355_length_3077_cov_25_407505_g334_i0_p3_ORF_typecomplete_len127_score0_84NECFESHC/PF16621_5/0_058Guanylin/PF02058_15/0_2_NODE_355_length_3077_cov_25_407505_g334_i019122292